MADSRWVGVEVGGSFDEIEHFMRGITIGTHATIERKGAPLWVVTMRGFRATLIPSFRVSGSSMVEFAGPSHNPVPRQRSVVVGRMASL